MPNTISGYTAASKIEEMLKSRLHWNVIKYWYYSRLVKIKSYLAKQVKLLFGKSWWTVFSYTSAVF